MTPEILIGLICFFVAIVAIMVWVAINLGSEKKESEILKDELKGVKKLEKTQNALNKTHDSIKEKYAKMPVNKPDSI